MLAAVEPQSEVIVPRSYDSPTMGEPITSINYPAVGNVFEIWPEEYTDPNSESALRVSWLGASAIINPTNPAVGLLDLQTSVIPKTGTVALACDLHWPATHPSVGTWVRNVFANYGPALIPTPSAQSVDWPIYATVPRTINRYQQDFYFMLFGALVNVFRGEDHRRVLNHRLPSGSFAQRGLPLAQSAPTRSSALATLLAAGRPKN